MNIQLCIAISSLIAAGALALYKALPKEETLREKVKKLFFRKNIENVVFAELDKVMIYCPGQKALEDLYNDGYKYILAAIDYNGNVRDVELYKEIHDCDIQLKEALGDERMVVITK